MNAQTVFFCGPEELTKAIDEAIAPFTQKLIDTYRQVKPLPSVLSIAWIAQDCLCGRETVRRWIVKGLKAPARTNIVKLKVVNGITNGLHLIRLEDYENFLYWFPAIRAQSKTMSLMPTIPLYIDD